MCAVLVLAGDAYIATTGCALTEEGHMENPATRMLEFASEIINITESLRPVEGWDHPIRIRVGVHTGPAIASAIGRTSYKFTFIGDTVRLPQPAHHRSMLSSFASCRTTAFALCAASLLLCPLRCFCRSFFFWFL